MWLELIYFLFRKAWGALFVWSCVCGILLISIMIVEASMCTFYPPAHVSALVSFLLVPAGPALADVASVAVLVLPWLGLQSCFFHSQKMSSCFSQDMMFVGVVPQSSTFLWYLDFDCPLLWWYPKGYKVVNPEVPVPWELLSLTNIETRVFYRNCVILS